MGHSNIYLLHLSLVYPIEPYHLSHSDYLESITTKDKTDPFKGLIVRDI